MGNIGTLEAAYVATKKYIVYDSFHTIMVAIVIFLVALKMYEELQKNIAEEKRFNMRAYWGHIKIYILVFFIATFSGQILTLTESICGEMQQLLIDGLGGDSTSKATDEMEKLVLSVTLKKASETNVFGLVSVFLDGVLSSIPGSIGIFIYKHIYTFFIASRYMWLLMLELVAPIAISLCIHEATRSYFYTWLKNMMVCYLLIPMFLLADKFSNSVTLAMMGTPEWEYFSVFLCVCCAIFIKIKMFSVVKAKASQLF